MTDKPIKAEKNKTEKPVVEEKSIKTLKVEKKEKPAKVEKPVKTDNAVKVYEPKKKRISKSQATHNRRVKQEKRNPKPVS